MHFTAVYSDNTAYSWDDEVRNENAYQKIDRLKLKVFELRHAGKLLHRLHLEDGQRLILRRRTAINTSGGQFSLYLVGYQETVNGTNRRAITAIFEDGHTELIGSWKNAPLHDILLRQEELGD